MKSAVIFLGVFLCSLHSAVAQSGLDVAKMPGAESGKAVLAGNRKTNSNGTTEIIKNLKDEDVFLDIEGRDILRWGLVREHLDAVNIPIPMHSGIDASQRQNVQDAAMMYRMRKLFRAYLQNAPYAVAAVKAGVVIPAEEFEEMRRNAREKFAKRGENGARMLKLMDAPESFFEHNLTNMLYAKAYGEKIVKPTLVITKEEINERIEQQENDIRNVLVTNAWKCAKASEILNKVKDGMDFAKAAEQWSDCPTFDTGGVFTDENEKPQHIRPGDVRIELEEAYNKLSPGEIGGVVETPFSWHILKLLERKEDGDDKYVVLAHIMLEKSLLPPRITAEQAKKRLSNMKLRLELKRRFPDLFKDMKVECKIPVFDKPSNRKSLKRKTKNLENKKSNKGKPK